MQYLHSSFSDIFTKSNSKEMGGNLKVPRDVDRFLLAPYVCEVLPPVIFITVPLNPVHGDLGSLEEVITPLRKLCCSFKQLFESFLENKRIDMCISIKAVK